MDATFSIAQNGIVAGDQRQGVIANNLANLTTDGFRANLIDQATLVNDGTRINGITEDHKTVGAPRQTGIPEHLMIQREGFFQVQTGEGVAYTRVGNFQVDSEGQLTTPAGYIVEPGITVPEENLGLRVLVDGTVYANLPDGTAEELGQIELARFVNPSGLHSIGDSLYVESDDSGEPQVGSPGDTGFGIINQFQLEGSNVDPSTQLTDLLVNQRYQQFNLRVFQTSDSLVGRALDLFS